MQFLKPLKSRIQNFLTKFNKKSDTSSAAERIARLERNYLVLLKRMLEMDGVKLNVTTSKASNMSSTVFQTKTENENNGLNENKPTIH
jgi:hypothetical protein